MPEVVPPQPTHIPSGPRGQNWPQDWRSPQHAPRPAPSPHHTPSSAPASEPQPQPLRIPSRVVTGVAIATQTRTNRCPDPENYKADRDYPQNRQSAATERVTYQRQSPCESGDPIITYTPRRRKLGVVAIPKDARWAMGNTPERELKRRVRQLCSRKGYTIKDDGKYDIEVEGPREPETTWERVRDFTSEGGDCIYDIYLLEQRRNCECPDGSKCRKTRIRRDEGFDPGGNIDDNPLFERLQDWVNEGYERAQERDRRRNEERENE